MNRTELVADVRERLPEENDFPLDVIDAVIGALLRVARARAGRGEQTSFGGLGYFAAASIAARSYKVPRKAERVEAGERTRIIFVASAAFEGVVNHRWVPGAERAYGREELVAALRRACDGFEDARRRTLNKTGVLCWACDGDGEAGHGAWVRDTAGVWVCASGAEPFLMLDERLALMVVQCAEAAIKGALYKGGEVEIREFGVWSVKNRPAGARRVPLWSGGSAVRNCPTKKSVRFVAYLRP